MDLVLFHWSDYLIFAIILLSYALIGLFFKFKYDRGVKRNLEDYFLANKTMTLIPVTASILVSFFSAISILGTVAEVYVVGIEYVIIGFSYFIAMPISAYVYLPTFYRLKIVSVYEYLELRFSKVIRTMASILFVIHMIFYMSIVLYAPSLALSQVSGLSLWISILSTGVVCTFYTTIGGMRAVIWTDLVQFFIMVIGILTVVIVGSIRIGGFSIVWEISKKAGRTNLFNFDPNPFVRHSFWSLVFGASIMYLTIYGTNQAQVQRYLSCRTEKVAIRSLLLNAPLTFGFMILLTIAGLVTFASLISCDPLTRGVIWKSDQVFPYFVLRLFQKYSPLPGLFISSIFAAALSTMSSGINSLSGVIMEDLLKLCPGVIYKTESRRDRAGLYSKLIAFGLGVITILLAFLYSLLSTTILQISTSFFGMAGGPILSVFTMGLLIPCINEKGALAGFIGSFCVTLWIGIGAIVNAPMKSNIRILKNVTECSNFTLFINQTTTTTTIKQNSHFSFYNLSYLYFTLLAVIISTSLALVVSVLTGFNSKRKIDKKLFFVLIPKLTKHWPKSFQSQILDEKENSEKESIPCLQQTPKIEIVDQKCDGYRSK